MWNEFKRQVFGTPTPKKTRTRTYAKLESLKKQAKNEQEFNRELKKLIKEHHK